MRDLDTEDLSLTSGFLAFSSLILSMSYIFLTGVASSLILKSLAEFLSSTITAGLIPAKEPPVGRVGLFIMTMHNAPSFSNPSTTVYLS